VLHDRLADPDPALLSIIDPRPTIRTAGAIQNTYAVSLLQAETLAASFINDWPVVFADADSASEPFRRAANELRLNLRSSTDSYPIRCDDPMSMPIATAVNPATILHPLPFTLVRDFGPRLLACTSARLGSEPQRTAGRGALSSATASPASPLSSVERRRFADHGSAVASFDLTDSVPTTTGVLIATYKRQS
jgi:hypothetical protein